MAMELIMGVIILLAAALLMYFIGKMLPFVPKVVSIVVMVYFLGLFLSLGDINIVSELVAKIPGLVYMLTFGIGSQIGALIADFF